MKMIRVLLVALLSFGLGGVPALAWDFAGTKNIYLHTKLGEKVLVGTVEFKPAGDQIAFVVHWDHAHMKDYFLSMREFKCLDGVKEVQCQVPYPYKSPKSITQNNFSWLENNLLFLYKSPKDFGANLWNGIYYELKLTDAGLIGLPQAIDLVAIGSPPDKLDVPPYPANERSPMPPGSRWFSQISIE